MKNFLSAGLLAVLCSLTLAAAASAADPAKTVMTAPLHLYTLRNANGCEAKITNYGGILLSLTMPDKDGHLGDVVLGFDTPEAYTKPAYTKAKPYFGALIGRYGNRIDRGRFTLDGKEYQLAVNDGPNHLHGGKAGFDARVWDAREFKGADGAALELTYVSPDGEEGYPGTLTVKAVYTLTDKNELRLEFTASSDRTTIINLTAHTYFNLKGGGDILSHVLQLHAASFLPVNEVAIPLGEMRAVKGTPFDFTAPTSIGAHINDDDLQIKHGKGYDHDFVVDGYKGDGALLPAARVEEPTTGRVLEVETTEPGVQFYSGNFLDGTLTGKGGQVYQKRNAFCLEPQHHPDSPHHPAWPAVVLKAGQTYHNTILYRFSVKQ